MDLSTRVRLVLLTGFVLTVSAWAMDAPLASLPRPVTELAKLIASDGVAGDAFGMVAVEGDTAIVGALRVDGEAGAAYVFVRSASGWMQQAKLVASDRLKDSLDLFGHSVAISGDTVAVAALGAHPDVSSGAAYVFVRNGSSWSEQAKLLAPDASDWDSFGVNVAISGNTIAVGSYGTAVWIFVRNGQSWSFQTKLVSSSGQRDFFGHSIAMTDDTLVVGAPSAPPGAVYIFKRSGSSWYQQTKLLSPELFEFGCAVAVSGGTVAVGAREAVYVLTENSAIWSEQARLLASDGQPGDAFGCSTVALSGNTMAVGAAGKETFTGAAYLFLRRGSDWSEQAKLIASDRRIYSSFGAVALSGNMVVVGASGADGLWATEPVGVGAVYLFSASGVAVAPTAGLLTLERGGTATSTVMLDFQPTDDVVIDLASNDTGEGIISPTQLTFTLSDWWMPQTVTLTGVNDFADDDGQPYTVSLSMNQELTRDMLYAGVDPDDVSAVNLAFDGDFYTVSPCRVLDTREPEQQPPLVSGGVRMVAFHDTCGVPVTARAVAINATVVEPAGNGHLTLGPDLSHPGVSTFVFKAGRTRAHHTIALLATDGTGLLKVAPHVVGGGAIHLVIDIAGYFE